MPKCPRLFVLLVVLLAAVSAGPLLAGCAANGGAGVGNSGPSAALEDLADEPARVAAPSPPASQPQESAAGDSEDSLAAAARRSADDLAALFAEGSLGSPQRGNDDAGGATPTRSAIDRWGADDDARRDAAGETTGGGEVPSDIAAVEAEVADAGEAPVAPQPVDAVRAMLDKLEADAGDPELALSAWVLSQAVRSYAGVDDGATAGQSMNPAERRLMGALEPVMHALWAAARRDAPDRVSEAIREADVELGQVLSVRIADVALAREIRGYGSYTPMASNRFVAGRPARALVYTEPARFVNAPASPEAGDGELGAYEVKLGLELRLFNERGSMLAWRQPEEIVVDRSDRRRREMHLGTLIELPSSLTVGRYQLKVILRDLADDSVDERVIPIEVVADPRLAVEPTRAR
ncbi:MAG: hypothetical protein AAFX79_10640 [Planctomycetota bacterium]